MTLPDAADWQRAFGGTPDMFAFVEQRVSLSQALATARLLWPELVVERGCVLIQGRYSSASLTEWLEHLDGDISAVERTLNHVHLWDLFDEDPSGTHVADALRDLADVMAATWRCALAQSFPERHFDVQWSEDESDYGPTVSFWSVTP